MTSERIGLLGGTFDPVHNGHLQLASAALKEWRLDRVVFIPSAEPPHKIGASIASFEHRLAMLALAHRGQAGFSCSGIEGSLAKPSYTVDTLRALRRHYPDDCQLFFMIGADAFLDILTWKAYPEILRSVNIILSRRKGYRNRQLVALLEKLGYKGGEKVWQGEGGKGEVCLLDRIPEELSSSEVRAMLRRGETEEVRRLLPETVWEYILANKLYR